jgi:hypothetical protein
MLDDLDYPIRMAINQLMLVLYQQGITEIHTGGLMRLLGVPNEVSQEYDDERIILDDNFVKYVREFNSPRSSDQSLH